MPATVSLREVVEELDLVDDERTAFVNIETGKPLILTDDEMSWLEEGAPDQLPEWQQDFLAEVREPFEKVALLGART